MVGSRLPCSYPTGAGKDAENMKRQEGNQKIVSIADAPAPNGAMYAVQRGVGQKATYVIGWKDDAHPFCPGTYRMRMFAKYAEGFVGNKVMFHARFFNTNGIGKHTAVFPEGDLPGVWPTAADEWQQIEATVTLNNAATNFEWCV